MKYINKEENDRIIARMKNEIQITDYAHRLGFTLKRVGSYYTLVEHDSVRIDPVKNIFYRNSQPSISGRSIFDFLIEFQDGINNFHDAMVELGAERYADGSYTPIPKIKKSPATKPAPKAFELPERDNNVKNVYSYLINTRHIDKEVVSKLMGKGYIKQDKHKNCMFVGYEDTTCKKPVFACLRGTNTEKPFKGDVSGSDYSKGFYIDNGSTTLCVTESPIDAMSFMTLYKMNGGNPFEYNYLSLSSVNKDRTLYARLENENIDNVILCLDNDDAGIKAAEHIKSQLENCNCNVKVIIPKYKDLNECLCKLSKTKSQSIKSEKEKYSIPSVTPCHHSDYSLSL